ERLVLHHVTPVTRAVSDRDEQRPVLALRSRERLVAPGMPVHRVVHVLAEIGARLGGEPVGGAFARCAQGRLHYQPPWIRPPPTQRSAPPPTSRRTAIRSLARAPTRWSGAARYPPRSRASHRRPILRRCARRSRSATICERSAICAC